MASYDRALHALRSWLDSWAGNGEGVKRDMRICAGGLLVRGNEILLAKRSVDHAFYPGVWDVVGGMEACARRRARMRASQRS
jgi:hypothetical protein